jgi:CRP/FNR family transcriptional regulator, cyclic AMP receptor protein
LDDNDDIAAIATALGCESDAARALLASSRVVDVASATPLVHQGDPAPYSWLILDGAIRCEVVSTEGRMTVVATHPPGDIVGAFGMAGVAMAGALVTHGRARLLSMAEEAIERLACRA